MKYSVLPLTSFQFDFERTYHHVKPARFLNFNIFNGITKVVKMIDFQFFTETVDLQQCVFGDSNDISYIFFHTTFILISYIEVLLCAFPIEIFYLTRSKWSHFNSLIVLNILLISHFFMEFP